MDYSYKCKIVKIIDGDTADIDIDLGFDVWLRNQRVRFMGIDTPESRTSNKEEKVFGLLAKDFVKGYLPTGSSQTLLTFKDETGKFGRILADFLIEINGEQKRLVQHMIDSHMGVPYFGQSKNDIEDLHLANRKILIESGLTK